MDQLDGFRPQPRRTFRSPDQFRRIDQPEVAGAAGRSDIRASYSYGSFNTAQNLLAKDGDSGTFGPERKDTVLFNINQMQSDGYQTYNPQRRDAGYAKFQHRFSDKTSLSLYGGVVDIWNHTPKTTSPTRQQVQQFGDNYLQDNTAFLINGTPDPFYYGYSALPRADRF